MTEKLPLAEPNDSPKRVSSKGETDSRGNERVISLVPTVAGLSFFILTLELLIARMSVFYINAGTSYVAIPLTLLGLAIGSLVLHLRPKALENFDVGRSLMWLCLVAILCCTGLFVLFTQFPIVHAYREAALWLLLGKTLTFVVLLLVPLALAGRILAALFTLERLRIGQLYGADLAGAAGGALATPIMLHFFDLPVVITVALVVLAAIIARHSPRRRFWKLLVATLLLAPGLCLLMTWLEDSYNMTSLRRNRWGGHVRELVHEWNEYSRVSLLELGAEDRRHYLIIHDNAESNVNVGRYVPGERPPLGHYFELTDLPFRLGRPVENALVMFAGCGAQMIQINEYSRGRAMIRGAELNPLVLRFAIETPEIRNFRIGEFLDLDNIDLRVQEGRSLLRQDSTSYDLIYAGSDAPTSLYKTGHSRKYLDTYEAMEDYVERLERTGLLIFEAQPSIPKFQALRLIHQERFDGDFSQSILILGRRGARWDAENNHLVYSPNGFSQQDRQTVRRSMSKRGRMLYGADTRGSIPELVAMIEGDPPDPEVLVTDDRPYLNRIDWEGFSPFPETRELAHSGFYRNWIRITSLLLVSLIVVLLMVTAVVGSKNRPSTVVFIHLLLSGIGYMLCQIAFLGKLELFLGSPLVTMAVLLSLFLLMNGLGSVVFSRLENRMDARYLCVIVLVIIPITLFVVDVSTNAYLGWPLIAKLIFTSVVLAPLTLCLGLFYPFAVAWLTRRGQAKAVPITFGLSTLSSVLGGTWALVATVNFGYSGIVYQAMIIYGLLAAFFVAAGGSNARLSK